MSDSDESMQQDEEEDEEEQPSSPPPKENDKKKKPATEDVSPPAKKQKKKVEKEVEKEEKIAKKKKKQESDDDEEDDDDESDEEKPKNQPMLTSNLGKRNEVPRPAAVVDANDLISSARMSAVSEEQAVSRTQSGTVDSEALKKVNFVMRWAGMTEGWAWVAPESVVHFVASNDDGTPPSPIPILVEEFTKNLKESTAYQQTLLEKHATDILRQIVILDPGNSEKQETPRQIVYCLPVELAVGPGENSKMCTTKYIRDKIEVPLGKPYTALYSLGKEAVKALYAIQNNGLPRAFNPDVNKKTIAVSRIGSQLLKSCKNFTPPWLVAIQGKAANAPKTAPTNSTAAGAQAGEDDEEVTEPQPETARTDKEDKAFERYAAKPNSSQPTIADMVNGAPKMPKQTAPAATTAANGNGVLPWYQRGKLVEYSGVSGTVGHTVAWALPTENFTISKHEKMLVVTLSEAPAKKGSYGY